MNRMDDCLEHQHEICKRRRRPIRARVAIAIGLLICTTSNSFNTSAFTSSPLYHQHQPRTSPSFSCSKEVLLLEPIVERHVGILPPEACKELIRLGNLDGFTGQQFESIDDFSNNNTPSQSIEVYEGNDGITSPAIWKALEPYIPQLTELVKQSIDKDTDRMYFPDKADADDREPQLDWVFFRKYSPDTPRNSLKLHVDSNMHTLNIALNDDFKGGGLFYVCPPAQQEETEDGRPNIPEEYMTYDWLNNVKRENTTDVVFPNMGMGDVLVHNYTVWHAVAPLEVGTRYSFVLFYDMDNPAIQTDFYDDDTIMAVFYHEIEDVEIDLVWAGNTAAEEEDDGDESVIMIEEKMKPFEDYALDTSEGQKFRALIGDVVVAEFVIPRDYKEMRGDGKYQSVCVNFYP